MRHVYDCPVRWADLDQLGHVNNVVYVDYLQEARIDLMRAILPAWRADLAEGVVVVRHEVTYVSPMPFRFRPVKVECWVTQVRAATFTIAYEVFHEVDGALDDDGRPRRQVYVRASTVLTPYSFELERPRRISAEEREHLDVYLEPDGAPRPGRIGPVDVERAVRWPLHVRFSDVDAYRHVNNVKYFEYLQESRIKMVAQLRRDLELPELDFVVAQTDVDYLAPILLRPEPYAVDTEIVHVGNRSLTFEVAIVDPRPPVSTLARGRVTVVFWDDVEHRSTEPPVGVRELLRGVARPSPVEDQSSVTRSTRPVSTS